MTSPKHISPLLGKLLRRHISMAQLAGFAVAGLLGLTVVALAVQMWCDVRPLFTESDSLLRKDYLLLSRRVTNAGALLGATDGFDADALDDISSQPWCMRVGPFAVSNFPVHASIGLGESARSLHTGFFFESIPDDMLDVDASVWTFNPSSPMVPVVVSRDYLSLYNFGFAATQGLPRISEGQAGMLPLLFTLSGNGRVDVLPGRLVGFSNRVNGVLVPQAFLDWANARYASGESPLPQRVLVEVNNPGDRRIAEFVGTHGYEVGGDKITSAKADYFLTVAMSVVAAVGLVITALALLILVLSLNLLLQKNEERIRRLLRLGYTAHECARPYVWLVCALGVGVWTISALVMWTVRTLYLPTLHELGSGGGPLWPATVVSVAVIAVVTITNAVLIHRRIRALAEPA